MLFPSVPARLRRLALLAIPWASLAFAPAARSQIVSDFSADEEGWVVVDLPLALGNPPPVQVTYQVDYFATGGNPGGYISEFCPSALWFWFSAPAKFLGDRESYYGGTLSFDMATSQNSGVEYPAAILVGDGIALHYATQWPNTTFTSYAIPLVTTGWRLGSYTNGPEPTEAQMRAVLADLQALYLDGDWSNIDERSDLDNVRLTPPETSVPPGIIDGFTFDGDNPVVLFTPDVDGSFVLETSPGLGEGSWDDVGLPMAGTAGVQLSFTVTPEDTPQKFFRVRGL